MDEIEYVERLPSTCWECGARIRGTRQESRRQKTAQAKIFFAWMITLISLPAVMVLGIGVIAIYEIRLGYLSIPYIGFLFGIGTLPGGILYKQGRSIPQIFTVQCGKCEATRQMIIDRERINVS